MFNKIIKFIKYHNAFTVALAIVLLGFSGAMASETVRDAVLGEAIVEKSGVDNSLLLSADLDNFDFSMQIVDVSEDEDNYYIAYSYQTLDIVADVWQNISKESKLDVSKEFLGNSDLGLYAAEELGEIIDGQLAYLKKVKEKETAKGQTLIQETTSYTGLIELVLNPKTKELPGYEPVVKPPARSAFVDGVPSGGTQDDLAVSDPDSASGSNELCAGSVCINEQQLKALLQNTNSLGVSPPSGGETPAAEVEPPNIEDDTEPPVVSDVEPPTLTLMGNNPAEIEVGSVYGDLGVVVTDNVDQNLGYEVWSSSAGSELEYLGRNLTGVSVDTNKAGEWAISYTAEDQAGNRATTTRRIVVEGLISNSPNLSNATTTPEVTEPPLESSGEDQTGQAEPVATTTASL